MDAKTIVIVVIVVLLVFFIIQALATDSGFSSLSDASVKQVIKGSDLGTGDIPTMNFTYSIWFYVKDWNYKYGQPKIIFGRLDKNNKPAPSVVLDPMQNNVKVSMSVYPGNRSDNEVIHNCNVANVPIQKWVNLMISVFNKTMDIYMDGKLVRTCMLPGLPRLDNTSDLAITPAGGFSGFTSKLQYWEDSADPQRAWNTYRSGWSGNWLSSLFRKYEIKVTLMDNGVEEKSITI
jgi:hypothetical protein